MTAIIEANTTPIGVKLATHAGDLGLKSLHIGNYHILGRHTAEHMNQSAPHDEIPGGTVIYIDRSHPVAGMEFDGLAVDDGVLVDILHAARAITLQDTRIQITDTTGMGLNIEVDDPVAGWMVHNFFHGHDNQMAISENPNGPDQRVFFGPDHIGTTPQPIIQLGTEEVVFQYEGSR